ncbi:DCD domain-containing protein NRP-B-like [Diospyros lotus]|uniref:DCD domain-containing protein NRP-B-like n=1 Tax=Diospyros lotus TaxID=55363 RepID=UPI002257E804|nr:DCD domain-containing protein NRP-B-like [Diospyros lotus]
MDNNQQSFRNFSDQLRVQTNNLVNLSLNDSIWSNSYVFKRPEERRNFDIRVGGELNPDVTPPSNLRPKDSSDFNGFNHSWKVGGSDVNNHGDGWNSSSNLKQHSSDFNGFNHGWKIGGSDSSSTNLKQHDSDFNGFNHSWKIGGSDSSSTNLTQNDLDFNGFNHSWKIGGSNSSNNFKQNDLDFNGFNHSWKIGGSDLNGFNDGWKLASSGFGPIGGGLSQQQNVIGLNGGFNKGIYSKHSPTLNYNNNNNGNVVLNSKGIKSGTGKGEDDRHHHHHQNHHSLKSGKKNRNGNNNNNNKDNNDKNSVEKRFKTLPASEALPRNETIGGYIFVCNNDTMQENLRRQLFGLPPRYRDSVRAITPGLPLFLYNYSTHQLHGIFEAASFGGTNIDPTAWEDKKNPGESRFPAQVRVVTREVCEPLEEDSFRPILHHYDGPKFRLELSIPEALSLLDVFAVSNAA